ncbi:ABC transporter substrate-binding protein, partial [Acinetobacter baumannii]
DHQQAVNAILAGELDFIEQPPHDLLPLLKGDPNIALIDVNVMGNQYVLRPNWTAKPFDDVRIRQAMIYAFNQEDFLKA